jgi:hypothetical protein
MDAFADSLGALGSTAFRWSALALVLVNGLAVAAFVITKDRLLVNRWTPRLVGANLLLIGTGLGVPLAAQAIKTVISVASTSQSVEIRLDDADRK